MTAEQILLLYQTFTSHPLFNSSEFTVHAKKFVTYKNKSKVRYYEEEEESKSKDGEEDEEHERHLYSWLIRYSGLFGKVG